MFVNLLGELSNKILNVHRQFSEDQGANYHSLKVLDEICEEYETQYYQIN